MSDADDQPTSEVESYLDDLAWALTTDPARTRRILAECEQHLLESIERRIVAGAAPPDAARDAIAAFGAPTGVARRFTQAGDRLPLFASIPQLALGVLMVGALLGIAMGISGILTALAGWQFGLDFVAGSPGVVYSAERCADFFAFHPEASTCADAATKHHFNELLDSRFGLGVAGLFTLALYLAGRRWLPPEWRRPRAVPLAIVPATAGGILAIIGLLELGLSLSTLASDPDGAGIGAHLVNAPVALAFAAANGAWLLHTIRAPRPEAIA